MHLVLTLVCCVSKPALVCNIWMCTSLDVEAGLCNPLSKKLKQGERAPVALGVLGSTPCGERIFQDLTAFVLSVVGVILVNGEAPVVTSSILRICRHSLRRCS
jgi:hypothetical protein